MSRRFVQLLVHEQLHVLRRECRFQDGLGERDGDGLSHSDVLGSRRWCACDDGGRGPVDDDSMNLRLDDLRATGHANLECMGPFGT
ncbi:hypothetical protein MFUL124B02_02930 [Myxococcus fulvus 124B02]|nr:hypothetical protein MFUL124B02_02930 [Myxococcus fulvus 124B02]